MRFLLLVLTLFYLPVTLQAVTLQAVSLQEIEATFPSQSLTAKKYLASLTPEQMDANWNLNDFFGSVVLINLPRCTDRLVSIKEELKAIGCKQFQVFSGVDGREVVPESVWKKFDLNWANIDLSTEDGRVRYANQRKGEAGCYLSHYNVIKSTKESFDQALKAYQEAIAEKNEDLKKAAYQNVLKYRSVMILEDDTGFGLMNADRMNASSKGSGQAFYEAMSELPADWDMFYLMTYCRKNAPNEVYKPHLVKVNAGFSAIAYAVHHSMYDRLLQKLAAIEDSNRCFILPVDSVYATIHEECRCYAVIPSIAYQKIGVSTIHASLTPEVIQFQPLLPL